MKIFNIILIVLALIILLTLLILSIVNFIFMKIFKKRFDGDVRFSFKSVRDYPNLKEEFVTTINRKNIILNGAIFYYPSKTYKGTIIFYHGLYSGYLNYLNVIEYYAKHNYKIVAFDFSGSMSSGGNSLYGMAHSEIDADAIIKFVINDNRLNKMPISIVGHSWGAHTAITSLLHNDTNIKKVVAFAPFNSHVDCCYSLNRFNIVLSPFIYLYNLFRFGHQSTYKVIDAMNYADADILIYCGGKDIIVKPEYSYKKFIKNQRDGVEIKYLKNANHFLYMSDKAATYFANEISWPRIKPISFNELDYKILDELNEPLLKETLSFLEK